MKRFRTILFWGHLAAGVSAGIVILIMSVTGAVLAFQPQILAWLERDVRTVRVVQPPGPRLTVDAIVAAGMAFKPSAPPASVTVESDPAASVAINFGRDGTIYVDPYSGRVLGEGARRARTFFQETTEWHRWLAVSGDGRQTARAVTGASNFAFLVLALSGLYLWMPRNWTRRAVKAIAWFQRTGTPRARNFNWHNVIGLWCAPAIIIMTATGVVMSYPWANRLVYQLAGTPLPEQPARSGPQGERPSGRGEGAGRTREGEPRRAAAPQNLDVALTRASERMPTWKSATVRLAPRPNGPLSLTLVDGAHWNAFARSTLTIDGGSGAVLRWEPYAAQTRGQKWRGWIRFSHTGELGGVAAQAIAGVACLGGAFLVWTGISLALRRFAAWRVSKRSRAAVIAASVLVCLAASAETASAEVNAQKNLLCRKIDAVERTSAEGHRVLMVPHLLSYGGIEQGIRMPSAGLTAR